MHTFYVRSVAVHGKESRERTQVGRSSGKTIKVLRPNCKVELKSFHFGVAVTTEISGMLKGVLICYLKYG